MTLERLKLARQYKPTNWKIILQLDEEQRKVDEINSPPKPQPAPSWIEGISRPLPEAEFNIPIAKTLKKGLDVWGSLDFAGKQPVEQLGKEIREGKPSALTALRAFQMSPAIGMTSNLTLKLPKVGKVIPKKGIVPPEPVVKPDGGFWLPEPPRDTKPLIDFARKEMSGSFREDLAKGFRRKEGLFDVVEQAHQVVLKARDMGENTANYVAGHLRRIGDTVNEFGVDANGMATKVTNPQDRSLAINDILSNYTKYDLTPSQIAIAKEHGKIYQDALKLARSYGVKIDEIGNPDELWQYIARKVKSKFNPTTGKYETPPATIGGGKLGAKISAQKERIFEEMLEGVDLGLIYENPDQTMVQHIKGIYRLIGNKQAEDIIRPITREVTKGRPLTFGERMVSQPALMKRAAAVDLANSIDKIFEPEHFHQGLKAASDISGAAVGQVAAMDISAPMIQGLPVLGHDLKQGLKGKPSFIWVKSYGKMLQTVKDPETILAFRRDNHDLYKRFIEAGGMTGDSEFVSGVSATERVLGKIPKAGNTLQNAYKQSYGRMGQAYSNFLEIARVKMFEQLEPVWIKEGQNINELGAVVNRMTGTVSSTGRGLSLNRKSVERIGLFAPNYLRSSLLLLKDMVGTSKTAREVQSSLATLLGVGAAVYFVEETMRGETPKMKPWATKWGGDGSEAFTIGVGDTRIGFGSWMYGMIKLLADVTAMAIDDPSAVIVWDDNHPIVRFLKSKRGAALGLATDLATGRNFFGKRYDSADDYLMRIVESLIPIASQSMITEQPRGTPAQSVAEFLGLRAFTPSSPSGKKAKGKTMGDVFGGSNKKSKNKTMGDYFK